MKTLLNWWGGALIVMVQLIAPFHVNLWAEESVSEEVAVRLYALPRGWVDRVDATSIVIDDLSSPLSIVQVYDKRGFITNISSVSVGEYVAFDRNDNFLYVYKIDEVGLRPASDQNEGGQGASSKEPGKTVIQQIDGVWKN